MFTVVPQPNIYTTQITVLKQQITPHLRDASSPMHMDTSTHYTHAHTPMTHSSNNTDKLQVDSVLLQPLWYRYMVALKWHQWELAEPTGERWLRREECYNLYSPVSWIKCGCTLCPFLWLWDLCIMLSLQPCWQLCEAVFSSKHHFELNANTFWFSVLTC